MKDIPEEVVSAVAGNAVSGGGIEGIGFGPKGEPGVYKNKQRPLGLLRRAMPVVRAKKLRDIIGK